MYTLTIAIHRGTITSRDIAQPLSFATMQECIEEVNKAKKWYASLGYVIWFANVVAPDGTKSTIESNSNYR